MAKVVEEAVQMYGWVQPDLVSDFDLTVEPPDGAICPPFVEVVWADDLAFSAIHEDTEQLIDILEKERNFDFQVSTWARDDP